MTNEEAKEIINMYVGVLLSCAMKDPDNVVMVKSYEQYKEAAKIACEAIDVVADRLELEHKEDGKDD